MDDAGIGDEAEKFDIVLADEVRDLGQRHLVLLHMKEHVAALAGGEEIEIVRDILRRLAVRQCQDVLPASPDILRREANPRSATKARAALMSAARELAVEPHTHEPAGAQQREQHPPAGPRIGHVMQHAARIHDDVEGIAADVRPSSRMSASAKLMLVNPSASACRLA